MRALSFEEANDYLKQVNMETGYWNRVNGIPSTQNNPISWINYRAPRDALALYLFAHQVANWLPKGSWKIFQIDDSSCFQFDDAYLFGRLLFGSHEIIDFNNSKTLRTFLFEFSNDQKENAATELLLVNLIYVFLLFENHGYVVSSNSHAGQCLGIQDGFIYFQSRVENISDAEILLKNFEHGSYVYPDWMLKMLSDYQEGLLSDSA